MKTIEQIAKEVAETADLSDTTNPETGAHEPIIEDYDQLASFIEDGIRAYIANGAPESPPKGVAVFLGGFELFVDEDSLARAEERLTELAAEQRYATALSVQMYPGEKVVGFTVRPPSISVAEEVASL
jgi:hypothetical protein